MPSGEIVPRKGDLPAEIVASSLPVNHPVRKEIDDVLGLIRSAETTGERLYTNDRSGYEYIKDLCGIGYLLDYIAKLKTSNRILDIGAGTTKGSYELQRFVEKMGLKVEATVLSVPKSREGQLNSDSVHCTAVEYLDGIENESIGGIIALASIMYSVSPRLGVRRIDQVLVPGGVLKATFTSEQKPLLIPNSGSKIFARSAEEFLNELDDMGYDTALDSKSHPNFDILLAIKPGGDKKLSASLIL